MSELRPDEAHCKKCGAPVRFGNVNTGKAYTVGIALAAEKVPHGAYDLVEHETEEGLATGKWLAIYVRAAERNNRKRYRQAQHAREARAAEMEREFKKRLREELQR